MIKTHRFAALLSLTTVLLFTFTFVAPLSVQADSIVWVIDKKTSELVQLDPATGAEIFRFDPGIKAKFICVDHEDQSVWVTDKKTVKNFSVDGWELVTVEGVKGLRAMACDSSTGSLWMAMSKTLLKLDVVEGQILDYPIKGKKIVAQSTNGSVWVIGSKELTNIGPGMNLLGAMAVKGVKAIAPHFADGSLWVASKKTLTKYDSNGNILFQKEQKGIRKIEPSDFDGSVWVDAKKSIKRLDTNGTELLSSPVKGLKGASADATDGSAWGFTSKGVAKVSAAGNPDVVLDARLRALAVARGPMLKALPDASVKTGQSPLQVTLIANGIDPNGVIDQYRWDFEGDGTYETSAATPDDVAHTYTASSLYRATLEVRNLRGSTATVEINVTGSAASMPSAFPTAGFAPLTVTFVAAAKDPDSTIETYEWDFEGDGSYDTFDQVARNYEHTYNHANVDPNTGQVIPYRAALKVRNSMGDISVGTVDILVSQSPPKATGEVDPSNGGAPLSVDFTGAGDDPDGAIALYEWDFEGDGVYDYSSPTTPDTAHTYNAQGTYAAVLRVTDNDGLTATAPIETTTVLVGKPGSPTARADAQPSSGVAPLDVDLTGTGTDDGAITLYEWDFEGDGVYDYSSPTTGATPHTYAGVGKFHLTLRVTDDGGLTGVDKTTVETSIEVNLSISDTDDTFNPTNSETIDVQTTYSTGVPVSVLIKDGEGNVVRKLVDNEQRAGGTYNDSWDGKDDNGLIVNDGIYYAILDYAVHGDVKMLDLTHTTGGDRYLPSRQSVRHDFSPYDDDYLDIHYSLNRASEVTVFVGILWAANQRVRTIINRAPRPAGDHIEYWDGLDDQEQMAHPPPNDSLILGLWGYTLPDNAMLVTGGRPVITNISADPNYLDPSTTCGSEGKTTVSYDLSEDVATVELRVIGLKSGKTVRTITQTNVTAGTNTIEWDGRDDAGDLLARQDFQLGLIATDSEGNESLIRYVLVRLFY